MRSRNQARRAPRNNPRLIFEAARTGAVRSTVALMEQDLLMVEFLLQSAHDGVTDLVSIAHANHGFALGGDHCQTQVQVRRCQG